MRNPCLRSILLAIFPILCIRGAPADQPDPASMYYSRHVGPPSPIASLPKQVLAPEGELTLYADFTDGGRESVALYLVNRTPHRIGFSSQDGDVYVKLEAATDNGGWERAQTHHGSWCGNSYFITPGLRPGEYFRFGGYFPSDGEPRKVRYRMYREYAFILDDETDEQTLFLREGDLDKLPLNLVSNVGAGKVPRQVIEEARRDGFAVQLHSFETVRDIATGVVETGREYGSSADRSAGVQALGRFPTEKSLALLRGFLTDADRSVAAAAMRGLATMGLELESAEQLYQELLQGNDVQLRASAIRALDERPITPEVIRFSKEQLSHDDLYVRIAAISVLGAQCKKDPEMKAFINSIYDDTDPKIQSIFETILLPTCIKYRERGYKGRFRDYERTGN
jgi:hypothetical protein